MTRRSNQTTATRNASVAIQADTGTALITGHLRRQDRSPEVSSTGVRRPRVPGQSGPVRDDDGPGVGILPSNDAGLYRAGPARPRQPASPEWGMDRPGPVCELDPQSWVS